MASPSEVRPPRFENSWKHVPQVGIVEDLHEERATNAAPPPPPPREAQAAPTAGVNEDANLAEGPSEPRIKYHPTAGQCYGYGPTILDEIRLSDKFREEREENIFYPFSCEEDKEMGFWLMDKGMSVAQIDSFFKLKYVRRRPLSFTSAAQLINRIEQLPKPPRWMFRELKVVGGTTSEPITLFFRDGLECLKFLFANPVFDGQVVLVPCETVDADDGQIYSEPSTGKYMYRIQSLVGEGETLGLVMLASDKTHLTNTYGDKYSHGVYMSCGNIKKDLRSKLSAKCWMKVAEIPVVKFKEKTNQGILTARLLHQCLDIVTVNLKKASHEPIYTPDPKGCIRLLRPLMFAHMGDNPEQQAVGCSSQSSSPLSISPHSLLGLSVEQRPRTKAFVLNQIEKLKQNVGLRHRNLSFITEQSRLLQLNGVLDPYWRDWEFADPCNFLSPDALHQWHRFFLDHPMGWARILMGDVEIDRRLAALQKRIGFRSFPTGFTRFQQHTGREQRDLQRSFIAIIAGHESINPGIHRAFRAVLDFIYIAQYESHSEETLKLLQGALRKFHANKHHLSASGVRDGPRKKGLFNIRKVELMMHVVRLIRELGSAPQFTADTTEHLHIDMAKVPYRATNRKGYIAQICRYLDRREKMNLFNMFIDWETCRKPNVTEYGDTDVGDDELDTDSEKDRVTSDGSFPLRKTQLENFEAIARWKYRPIPIKDHFTAQVKGTRRIIESNDTTVFLLTARITFRDRSIAEISRIYALPQLRASLELFFKPRPLPAEGLNCWDRVRMQLHTQQDEREVYPPYTVAAKPPDDDWPLGLCNFVLVVDPPGSRVRGIQGGVRGHYVAQIRLIFRIRGKDVRNETLLYIEPFKPAPGTVSRQSDNNMDHVTDDNVEMFRVVRDLDSNRVRRGRIIRLAEVWRPIELVPKFGKKCPPRWNSKNAVELAQEFYVNCFSDKETYQSVF